MTKERRSYQRSGRDRRRRYIPVLIERRRGRRDRRDETDRRRITLKDIVLHSLAGVDPDRFAGQLVELKVFPSVEAAHRALVQTPAVLARYVGDETSFAICSSLKGTGADVDLRNSHVNCRHCAFPVPCEGAPARSGTGITFACPSCHGLTMLDARDRSFHPLLRCSACHSLLNLPVNAREGKYRCRCGQVLSYSGVKLDMELTADSDEEPPLPGADKEPKPPERPPEL